jgi:hypothetical protein
VQLLSHGAALSLTSPSPPLPPCAYSLAYARSSRSSREELRVSSSHSPMRSARPRLEVIIGSSLSWTCLSFSALSLSPSLLPPAPPYRHPSRHPSRPLSHLPLSARCSRPSLPLLLSPSPSPSPLLSVPPQLEVIIGLLGTPSAEDLAAASGNERASRFAASLGSVRICPPREGKRIDRSIERERGRGPRRDQRQRARLPLRSFPRLRTNLPPPEREREREREKENR